MTGSLQSQASLTHPGASSPGTGLHTQDGSQARQVPDGSSIRAGIVVGRHCSSCTRSSELARVKNLFSVSMSLLIRFEPQGSENTNACCSFCTRHVAAACPECPVVRVQPPGSPGRLRQCLCSALGRMRASPAQHASIFSTVCTRACKKSTLAWQKFPTKHKIKTSQGVKQDAMSSQPPPNLGTVPRGGGGCCGSSLSRDAPRGAPASLLFPPRDTLQRHVLHLSYACFKYFSGI